MAIVNIETPDLGGSAEVTVIEVLVKPGDVIDANAAIVTLESDKATMEIPTTEKGTVKDVKVKVGDAVSAGAVLITLETEGAAAKPAADKPAEKPAEKIEKPAEAKKPASAERPVLTGTVEVSGENVHAGPGVRRLARELGVNLSSVSGTGPKSRVLKEDVQAFVKTQLNNIQSGAVGAAMPALPAIDFSKFGDIESVALSRIKKISGKALQRNWAMIPHVTQFGEADITELEAFRTAQKVDMEKQKIKLTPLVFILKAVVGALRAYPQFNASLDVSGDNIILKKYFHIGVAVDTPNGLVVPVIRDVDKKGLIELAKELAVISEKAREGKLLPGDMQGGCFSISSLGGIGGTAFTPIINYPEVAILGLSKSFMKPVYEKGSFVPRLTLPLSLSYDHRVVDGAEGARFMVTLASLLSDIRQLLM